MASKLNILKSFFLALIIAISFNGCFFSKPEFNIDNEGIEIQKFVKKFTKRKIIIKTNSNKKNSIIADIKKLNYVIK